MKEAHFIGETEKIFVITERPPEGIHFPTVLMLHGFTGQHIESSFLFSRFSRFCKNNGIATIRFDFRGSGDSDGEFYDMTATAELQDALQVLDFSETLPWVDQDRLFVLGLSMGGTISLRLVGRKPSRFSGCILWAAASENRQVFRRAEEKLEGPQPDAQGRIDIGGIQVGAGFQQDMQSFDALEESVPFSGPTLLVHGTADTAVDVGVSERAHQKLPNSRLVVIEGANHTFQSVESAKIVFEESLSFIRKVLQEKEE